MEKKNITKALLIAFFGVFGLQGMQKLTDEFSNLSISNRILAKQVWVSKFNALEKLPYFQTGSGSMNIGGSSGKDGINILRKYVQQSKAPLLSLDELTWLKPQLANFYEYITQLHPVDLADKQEQGEVLKAIQSLIGGVNRAIEIRVKQEASKSKGL